MSEIGLPISSDSIESLFGVAKAHGTGEVKDANRIAGHIPALCGQLTKEDAQNVLQVSCAQQQELMGNLSSLISQRRQILPNPGCLEDLNKDINHDIELIPRSKNRSKNLKNNVISDDYTKKGWTNIWTGGPTDLLHRYKLVYLAGDQTTETQKLGKSFLPI